MHRKLMISYQCCKLLPFGRHINQLPQKWVFRRSPFVAQGRCLSSNQSSEGDGGSQTPPATTPPTVATQSQSEVKTAKEWAKEEELKEEKRHDSEGTTAEVEPQLQAPTVEQVEPQLQAPTVEQVEPQLQAPTVEQVEPQLQATVTEQVEPQLQAPAVEEETQLQDPAAGEPVERHFGDVGVTAEVETPVAATQVAVETPNEMVTPQVVRAESEQDLAKGGKKSLLELLGTMKVDVTTKRKVRTPRALQAKPAMDVTKETTKDMFQEASDATAVQENLERGAGLAPELVAAATAAASTLPNRGQATSELLRQLRRHEAQAHTQQRGGENISDIIADMKVGRRANGRLDARPANQIRFDEDGRGYTHDRGITSELDGVRRRKSGFSGKRLNVFTSKPDDSPAPNTGLWDLDLANRIAMATNQLPRNGFEEMLLWTNQGKLWQYPINNEAGLEEEMSVPFHEHVFLERHLSKGFPSQGPVRHFMELVVAGLAKNPYLTANQKQEHIAWFRDYFQEKRDVLEEAEAYGS